MIADESDWIEKQETLHGADSRDIHLRYTGFAKGRTFLVNVQFDRREGSTGAAMEPIEFAFMVAKVLALIIKRVTNRPEPSLH